MLEIFKLTLITVAVLLLVAAPGYIMMKKKMLSEKSIAEFSKVLLYVSQTCLAIYTFLQPKQQAQYMVNCTRESLSPRDGY